MSAFPDYYKLLNIPSTATPDEIRQAYKRESLKTHPDRLTNATPAEKKAATERFQAVADAYYVLSDVTRRKEYDLLYASRGPQERTEMPDASSNFFSAFGNMFGAGAGTSTGAAPGDRPDAENVFADVFEELLRPEVERRVPWWTWVGAVSGAGLGFIVANIPGLMVGAYAGNRLGAIRDAKGKSVAAVFSQLAGNQKAEILRALAAKVLGAAGSALRASSVPAKGSRRPEWLDCVLMTAPRKRKRLTESENGEPSGSTQSQKTLHRNTFGVSQPKASQKSIAPRTSLPRSQAAAGKRSSSSTKKSKGTAPNSTSSTIVLAETGEAVAGMRATGLLTPTPSASFIGRTGSRTSAQVKQNASVAHVDSFAGSARKNKGKGKSRIAEDEESDENAPRVQSSRAAKRRRLSTPSLSLGDVLLDPPQDMDDVQANEPEQDVDFQMLDMPELVSFPWVPVGRSPTDDQSSLSPESSLYVPPGVSQLIETMKRALDMQTSARRKAENRHAEEMQRRIDAERAAARLAEENEQLEAERSAWTNAAAETLASTLQSALSSNLSQGDPMPQEVERVVYPSHDLLVADIKGKSKMVDALSFGEGHSNTLQRVAAVKEFLDRVLPLPIPDGAESMHSI
ncbi:putative J domain-containing protein C63.13 [Grifola frondosa]|uniref:Putative J domain-containing protein C63.13 n=1 Tax=Grifola frondosa TaxID=5627 RepID=A0A1C7MP69_GRIFR|nr:putative J domain-containing protein C63.13 [Grifola frondosa]